MTERALLVVIDPDKINQPAFNTVLEGYEAREFFNGAWIVKTNLSPQVFYSEIKQALRGAEAMIVSVDNTTIHNASWPAEIGTWVGVTRAA